MTMSPQKARSELMKFDSGPEVGTLRSEKLSGVRFGVIAQSWTSGTLGGGAALAGATATPIANTGSTSMSHSLVGHPTRPLDTISPSTRWAIPSRQAAP